MVALSMALGSLVGAIALLALRPVAITERTVTD
jgi:hypothetical protein